MSTVPAPSTMVLQFRSTREACRQLLRNAKTSTGRWLPVTVSEVKHDLAAAGMPINERDVEAFLRELAAGGEVVEIDADAGFRWIGEAA